MSNPIPSHIDRNEKIVSHRYNGWTYKAIGTKFGLSAARIRQIYRKHERQLAVLELWQLGELK